MRLGVLDIVQDAWIGGQDFLKPGKEKSAFSFNVPNGRIKLILHNNVNNEPAISEINIHDIAVKKIVQDAHTYSFRAEEIFAFTNANVRKIKKLADDKGITLASSSVWMPFFQLPEDAQRRGFSNNRRGHLVSIHQAKSYLTAYDDAIRQEMTDIGAVYAAFNGEDKEPERLAAFVLKNLFGGSEDE